MSTRTIFSARNWREYKHRYRLEGAKCKKCGYTCMPTRLVCPECQSRDFEEVNLSRKGKVLSYTVQHVAPSGFEDLVPYVVGIVELEDGTRLMSQIADINIDDMKTDLAVTMETRLVREEGHSGVLAYGYKFVPQR